jgi:release factor glutamine methyltransferase
VTIHARVAAARQRLRDAGIPPDEADLDARLLAEHALGWTTERYIVDGRQAEPAEFTERYDALVARRVAREPYAYIVGHEEFWALDFEVTPAVLIPRPETELVVEIALELIPDGAHASIGDVGTGSGCIAIAIAHDRPNAAVTAIDISSSALAVARRNAERHGVTSRVKFREGDLFAGVSERFDLIVSNPPYVPERDRPTIQAEVGRYEPATALFAGADGLDAIKRLLADAPSRLKPDAYLVFEFGYGQADAIGDLIANARGLAPIAIRADLQGIPRVAVAKGTAAR